MSTRLGLGLAMTAATLAACASNASVAIPTTPLTVHRSTAPAGWSPKELQSAYNLPSLQRGFGQIVADVVPYDNPDVANDLATYRSTFGLPTANLQKYNQQGQQSNYPEGSAQWGVQIDLDVEMISASCPNCTIYLIEADSNNASDLEAAETEAVKLGAHIVSNGFGAGSGFESSYFDTPGVTYLGPSGDTEPTYPADFASVVAVGGTSLMRSHNKRGWSEAVWSGDTGGCITSVRKPKWQKEPYCRFRLANDISAAVNGVAEYDSYDESGWISIDGTSVSAPFIAGVFGLAGNAVKQNGGRTFWEKPHQQYLYNVSEGTSGLCEYEKPHYTTCAGWGSPNGIGAF